MDAVAGVFRCQRTGVVVRQEVDSTLGRIAALQRNLTLLETGMNEEIAAIKLKAEAKAEPIRALAYRLYTLCERKGWAEEARAYNELVTAWSAIEQAAGEAGVLGAQGSFEL